MVACVVVCFRFGMQPRKNTCARGWVTTFDRRSSWYLVDGYNGRTRHMRHIPLLGYKRQPGSNGGLWSSSRFSRDVRLDLFTSFRILWDCHRASVSACLLRLVSSSVMYVCAVGGWQELGNLYGIYYRYTKREESRRSVIYHQLRSTAPLPRPTNACRLPMNRQAGEL